ncbi:MAG TPA: hypothetical protein PLL17_00895 [Defluviitaleaceae bacterium]|nr:hypothetical protein [Candidatus Epulonipiscium sp.]HOQ16012.1 hypothetical protein [Defluviitaleaceae bacterium]HPT77237.1 hypothetical protein [Defluviitaleaceae bacterium]HQD49676.1 hypothetical protein [Defluviitaleaceae bacterium]
MRRVSEAEFDRRGKGCDKGRNSATLPANIRELLKGLIDEEVIIVLKSGKYEEVEVLAVERNSLIARYDGKIKFVDIDCICEVLTDPEDFIEAIFKGDKC